MLVLLTAPGMLPNHVHQGLNFGNSHLHQFDPIEITFLCYGSFTPFPAFARPRVQTLAPMKENRVGETHKQN